MSLLFSIPSIPRVDIERLQGAVQAQPRVLKFAESIFDILRARTPANLRGRVTRLAEELRLETRAKILSYRVEPDLVNELSVERALDDAYRGYTADAINARGGRVWAKCPYRGINAALRGLGHPIAVLHEGKRWEFVIPEAPRPAGPGAHWHGILCVRNLAWSEAEAAVRGSVCFAERLPPFGPETPIALGRQLPGERQLRDDGRMLLNFEEPAMFFRSLARHSGTNRMMVLLGEGWHEDRHFRMNIRNVEVHFVPVPRAPQLV